MHRLLPQGRAAPAPERLSPQRLTSDSAVRAVLLPVNSALGCAHGAVRAVLMHVSWALCRAVAPRNPECALRRAVAPRNVRASVLPVL